MIRSLRARIALWYLAFFTLLFAAFGAFLYHVLASSLADRFDAQLLSQADTASALFDDEMEELHGDVPGAAHDALADLRIAGSHAVAIEAGRVLFATAPIPAAELSLLVSGAASGNDRLLALPALGRHGARAAVHYNRRGSRVFLLAAVAPLDPIAADLAVVRRALWFAAPLLLALAGLGGYWLASRELAPLRAMAAQSRQIGGASLDRRLEIGNAAGELTVLAQSFNELLGRLDQSFDSMKRFVADASHELRTPIAVIRGEADVALEAERGAGEYRAALAIVLDESRRVSRLVDDLLNLARADAGHVKLRVEAFYLNDLVAECCRSVQSLAAARGVTVGCAPGGDLQFRGDEELLRRMVVNLLDNAIRYTPAGGEVSVALAAEGGTLKLTVSDTGPGIAPEAAPHVFERFYRADKARSRQEGGFGLGLAIVKWIAESHCGTVELENRPGAGARFTVTLPQEAA